MCLLALHRGGANIELSFVPFVFLSTCQSNSGGGSSSFLFEYCITFGYQR
jgi:hypothetical protein